MNENDELSISVAMAVYNGKVYLQEQLDSILCQLREIDELIISYNKSNDGTWELIKCYEKSDQRIHCYVCKEKGVLSNFENAILKSKGDIICLADQDDIWRKDKIDTITKYFEEHKCDLILHDCTLVDKNGNTIDETLFRFRKAKKGIIKNLFRNCYQGCCMSFRHELCSVILPFPKKIAMHDQWIGLCAELSGNVDLIDKPLIYYRRHDCNTSGRKIGYLEKTKSIVYLIIQLYKRKYILRIKEKKC